MMDTATALSESIYEYGMDKKTRNYAITASTALLLILLVTMYFLFLKNQLAFFDPLFMMLFSHIKSNIVSLSYIGMFYITLIGGLFFVTIPIEPLFLAAAQKSNPVIMMAAALSGAIISYSIDYILGRKFFQISKNFIPLKQFYKIKAAINRRGAIAIFIANIIGVGSQQIVFILGVFRYSPTRLLLYGLSGQVIKYMALVLMIYFSRNIF